VPWVNYPSVAKVSLSLITTPARGLTLFLQKRIGQVFFEIVKEVWEKPVNTQDTILRVHVKLMRTTKSTETLEKEKFQWLEDTLGHPEHYLGKFRERAQEARILTQDEQAFKRYLESKALGLALDQSETTLATNMD
jgi:hypothetical protein